MKRNKPKAPAAHDRDPVLDIYFSKRNPRKAIFLMKEDRTYGQARQILPKLGMKMMHPELRSAISGNVKPTKLDQVVVPPCLPRSKDWLQEFGWLAHGFAAEARRLNSFFRLRTQFGAAYLLGDYARAKVTLADIQNEFGPSLWLAERELILLQTSAGFNAHKQRLSEIQSELTSALVGYIVTTCSTRLEPNVTPEEFLTSAQNALDDMRKADHDLLASWIELHIEPWSFGWLKDKHDMLWYCGGKTLIDRYDRVIKILSCIPLATLDQNERQLLVSILQDLESDIEDRQLRHLRGMLQPFSTQADSKTKRYFEAVDALVGGDCLGCAAMAEEMTISDPSCFEFLWLLAKASASSAGPVAVGIPENCVAREIFNHLYHIARNRVPIELPLIQLNLAALKLGDNHLGLSLRQLSQFEQSGFCDPIAAHQLIVQSKIDAYSLLDGSGTVISVAGVGSTLANHSKHVCVQLELYGTGDPDVGIPTSGITQVFSLIAQARRFALENKHSEVINALAALVTHDFMRTSNEVWVHGGIIARLQFEALVGLGEPEKAAHEVIRHYASNPNNLRHVPFERLIEGCLEGRWPSLQALPSWPILILFNKGSEQDIYEAVDDLLIAHGCSTPLSIADGTIACDSEELRIILRDILVPRVIARGALWNRTASERREMRKQILQKLYGLCPDDQALVVEELSTIEQAQLLETAYLDIEGPKFELNYSSVNRELSKVLEGAFNRYCEFRSYEEEGGALANEEELLTSTREGAEIRATKLQRSETSSILLLALVRAAFVHYLLDTSTGINSFLGTRIRHGSLVNQLTRVLDAHGLLALKNATGEYVCDSSVLAHLQDVDETSGAAVIAAHVEFTQTINALINNLVSEILRIRVPEQVLTFFERQGNKTSELRSDQGILDFSDLFSETFGQELTEKAFSSMFSLLTVAEAIFVAKANSAFALAREFLERVVAAHIQEALQRLENAIEEALTESPQRAALKGQVLAAKGSYSEDLKIISMWFSAAKPSEEGLGSLKDIVLMAARVVNFASNGKLGGNCFGNFENDKPASDVGRLMYEVISILLRNVVQHSRIETGQEVCFEHIADNHCRRLIVRNRICDEQECSVLIERAQMAIAIPFDDWALGSAPGGTGFVRIRKLLRQGGFRNVEINVRALLAPCRFETQIDYST
jgi:hypothetical protein